MHAMCHVRMEKEVEDEAGSRLVGRGFWADSGVISQLMMGRGQAEAVPSVHPAFLSVCPSACRLIQSFIHSFILPPAAGPIGVRVWCALIRSNKCGLHTVQHTHSHTHTHTQHTTHTHADTHARTDRQQAEAGRQAIRVSVQCKQQHNLGIGHRKHARQEPNDSGAREKGGEPRIRKGGKEDGWKECSVASGSGKSHRPSPSCVLLDGAGPRAGPG